jgi:acyl dehydratase
MQYFEDLEIGVSVILGSHELKEDDIIAYASKWDPQPFHIDPVAAVHTSMKGLTACSSHTFAVICQLHSASDPIASMGGLKYEIELPEPARPGDVLSLSSTCLDKRLSKSKPDRGLVTIESVLSNQEGKVVMRLRSLTMVHRKPAAFP